MYTVSIHSDFVSQHYLIGGDWGAENQKHSHHYRVELRLLGSELDEHGYLLDIDELKSLLAAQVARFRDRTLNELPAFEGLNPSLEHFTRILGAALAGQLDRPNLQRLELRLWEDEIAWASFTCELPCVSG